MRQEINHWMMLLESFLPTSALKNEVWGIENKHEEIEYLKQQIEDAEKRIVNRILAEYSQEEINIAQAKYIEIGGQLNAEIQN